ncbi:hypothetical protein MUK42_37277 [Musa troglodytarum]|uniref:Uncharacterized protein n=1 Tax=Musa troglodytarum TaxID=320322 RepID=A0A9E7GGH7_9LILI|nr:hypothetical protein MUK42_37277 [Musa troglodytarum]
MASRCSTMLLALLLFSLVMTARSANYSLHQDSDCDILGHARPKQIARRHAKLPVTPDGGPLCS